MDLHISLIMINGFFYSRLLLLPCYRNESNILIDSTFRFDKCVGFAVLSFALDLVHKSLLLTQTLYTVCRTLYCKKKNNNNNLSLSFFFATFVSRAIILILPFHAHFHLFMLCDIFAIKINYGLT